MSYSMPVFTKDPDSTVDFTFNWGDWLTDGDSIADVTITHGLGITLESFTSTSTAVTVWLSGGVVNEVNQVTCSITSAGGRSDDRTMKILIAEK